MLILGVVLDLLCWRWRKVAKILFFYECFYMIIIGLIPMNYGSYQSFITCIELLILVVMIGCNAGLNIITATILYFIISFVQSTLVEGEQS